jgi:hypothetical protein
LPTQPPAAGIPRHPSGCLQPVLLRGRVDHIDGATGELLHRYTTVHEPGGVLPIACKTRRASRCPPCAETYRADTYQLIRAGLSGGKGVPESVATHPCIFATLTAPSFGPVHAHREKDGRPLRCRPRRHSGTCPHANRLSCGTKHTRDDTQSASRYAQTATTTPARSCSTPARPNCGAASPSLCAGPSPARPGSPARPSRPSFGSPTPRSPNTSGAASSTSTPSSASTAPPDPPRPRPPGPPMHCSPLLSRRPPAPSASAPPPRPACPPGP